MGPQRAAKLFLERCPNASYYEVTLYGSLAATGKGHMTDVAIEEVLRPHKTVNIIWQPQTFLPYAHCIFCFDVLCIFSRNVRLCGND